MVTVLAAAYALLLTGGALIIIAWWHVDSPRLWPTITVYTGGFLTTLGAIIITITLLQEVT